MRMYRRRRKLCPKQRSGRQQWKKKPCRKQRSRLYPAAAPNNVQVPTWNLDTRIPIAPQVWDVDTPQIGVGAADDGVEIVNLEDSEPMPAAAEPPRISPKE
jgi:hypothetical protein